MFSPTVSSSDNGNTTKKTDTDKSSQRSPHSPSSPTTVKARQRLEDAGLQGTYINNHSVVPLLNDLLGTVVEEKPEDVLTFLIDYLTRLQTDVTKARQMLERKNKGATAAVGAGLTCEAEISEKQQITSGCGEITKSSHAALPIACSVLPTGDDESNDNSMGRPYSRFSHQHQFLSNRSLSVSPSRMIEVRVDGEVRHIPDYEDDMHVNADGRSSAIPFLAVAANGAPLHDSQPKSLTPLGGDECAGVIAPTSASTCMVAAAPRLILEEPIALRFLLKAATRQKTPSLAILVDLARSKASAIASGAAELPSFALISGGNAADTINNTKSRKAKTRSAFATASTLGIELLQRSTAGESFKSLSILNNHWMVRKQIVYAVDDEDTTPSTSAAGTVDVSSVGCVFGKTLSLTSMTGAGGASSQSQIPILKRVGSEGRMNSNDNHRASTAAPTVGPRSVSPPPAFMAVGGSSSITPFFSAQPGTSMPFAMASTSVNGVSQQVQPQRMIIVQDPTPVRLLLRAAERQYTPNLSLLIDFARKRYGGGAAIVGSSKALSGSTENNNSSNTNANGYNANAPITNLNLLGIEILQRSHAKSSGFTSLGFLSNHWMVRRQIVLAVKAKDQPTAPLNSPLDTSASSSGIGSGLASQQQLQRDGAADTVPLEASSINLPARQLIVHAGSL